LFDAIEQKLRLEAEADRGVDERGLAGVPKSKNLEKPLNLLRNLRPDGAATAASKREF
jgi:hypothetical protein